jgi:hypothetical protein
VGAVRKEPPTFKNRRWGTRKTGASGKTERN